MDAIEERGVMTLWMPSSDGSRYLDDPDDYEGGWYIDNATVRTVTPEGEAGTYSDTDAPLPFNLGVDLDYEGYYLHFVRQVTPESSGVTLAQSVVSVGYRNTDDGINWLAAVEKDGTTTGGQIVASNTRGEWGSVQAVAPLNGTTKQDISDMVVVGNRVLLISNEAGGHVVVDLGDVVGAAADIDGTLITAGYDGTTGQPNAVYVPTPSNVLVVGAGGHIYRAPRVTSGVAEVTGSGVATTDPLLDIHGFGDQVMAVGGAAATNAVVVSEDNGQTWAAASGTNVSDKPLNAVFMTAKDTAWIGSSDGSLYYTTDFGETFTAITHATGMTTIQDIKFLVLADGSISSIGYMAGTGTNRTIARTRDNGGSWHTAASDVGSIPANIVMNSLSVRKVNQLISGGDATSSAGMIITT